MRFMNECDILYPHPRYTRHPIKERALRIIKRLMEITNQISDGWAYWKKPATAAGKLMAVIEDMDNPTEKDLKKALTPIKSMITRNSKAFKGHTLSYE